MRIILLCCLSLCLIGCNAKDPMTNNDIPWDSVTEFSYKNHQYIKFKAYYQGAVVHNPECPCQKSYN